MIELIDQFKLSSGQDCKMNFTKRRPGDVAIAVASVNKAFNKLGWKASAI